MDEIWKYIEGYEGQYQVSNKGRVRSVTRKDNLNRIRKGKILKLFSDNNKGYLAVDLFGKKKKVHRLIAQTFIPNPLNKPQVNHIDGNKVNNEVGNLEWATKEENIQHSFNEGLVSRKGEKNSQSKLTAEDVRYIRANYKFRDEKFGSRALAQKFAVHKTTINRIIRGEKWRDIE